jgi:hypothetical protein
MAVELYEWVFESSLRWERPVYGDAVAVIVLQVIEQVWGLSSRDVEWAAYLN